MGEFLALLTAFFFSCSAIFVTKGQKHFSTEIGLFITILVNVCLSGLILFFLILFHIETLTFHWMSLLLFVIAGVFTGYLGRLLNFSSIKRIGPSRVSVVKLASPLFAFLIGLLLLEEVLNVTDYIAGSLILTGLFWINVLGRDKEDDKKSTNPLLGEKTGILLRQPISKITRIGFFLGIASAFSYAVGNSFRKVGLEEWSSPFAGAFIGAVVGFLCFIVSAKIREQRVKSYFKVLGKQGKGYFLAAGVLMTFAHLSLFTAYNYTSLTLATLLSFVEPIFVFPLAYVFLKKEDSINRHIIFGAFVVLIGVSVLLLY